MKKEEFPVHGYCFSCKQRRFLKAEIFVGEEKFSLCGRCAKEKPKIRKCLRCDKPFPSVGFRLCNSCKIKNSEAGISKYLND